MRTASVTWWLTQLWSAAGKYAWNVHVKHLSSGEVHWTRITGERQVNFALMVRATGSKNVKMSSARLWTEGDCRLVWRDAPWDNSKRIKQRGKKIWLRGSDFVTYHDPDTGDQIDPYDNTNPNELRLVGNSNAELDPDVGYYSYNGVSGKDGEVAGELAVMVQRNDDSCEQCRVYAEAVDERGRKKRARRPFRVNLSNGPAC